MKIVVHTGELAEKISAASMALGKKNVKPILAGFLFEADGNSFRITATDLETGIRAPIKVVEGSGKLKCVVPGDLMLKLVKVLPDETATLSFQKDTVVVRSGSATYKLTTMSADEYPDVAPGVGGTSYTLNSSLLYNLIKKTIFAAAKEQYTYYLNGVMWEFYKGKLRLVGSDGFRLAFAEAEIDNEDEFNFLLSLKSMQGIQSILESVSVPNVTLKYDGRRVSIMADDVETVMRVVGADYPDYKRVIPASFNTTVVMPKDELKQSLRRAMVIGGSSVKFEISGSVLRLVGVSPEYGEVVDEVKVDKEGDDLVIAFNPKFIDEALRYIETDEVVLKFIDASSPCQITPNGTESFVYIVMPIRCA